MNVFYSSGNFEMDVYNTSAKMSTYLLAFIVCDFEYTEDYTTKDLKVNYCNLIFTASKLVI